MISSNHPFAKQLCEVLELPKHTRSFELRVAVDEPMTIKCEFYPELPDDRRGELLQLIRSFSLVEKPEIEQVSAIGDHAQVWQLRATDKDRT